MFPMDSIVNKTVADIDLTFNNKFNTSKWEGGETSTLCEAGGTSSNSLGHCSLLNFTGNIDTGNIESGK